jgi:hypothetical protein
MMRESEELPDDVPIADAADQQRPVSESDVDEEDSAEPPSELPLEAAAADWQEQLESVEVDPDESFPTD